MQLSLGDALAISLMKFKNFGKLDFKKFHPAGNLANKLKTASDIMLTKSKIPFINENRKNEKCIKKLIQKKKIRFVIIINNDGIKKVFLLMVILKDLLQKKKSIKNLKIKYVMTKKPFTVDENTLASDILKQMNKKKITSVCVYDKKNKKKLKV